MLHITFSNQVEFLLATLTKRLQQSPSSPFVAEEIIVSSAAMQRKVELAITDAIGICANVRFSFLARWLWRQIGATLPDEPESPFEPPIMAWRIYMLLDDAQLVARHPRLRHYVQQADPVMRFDLAMRTAALFEQYLTYRSDWIEKWSHGELVMLADATDAQKADQQWQAALWQRLSNDLGGPQQYLSPTVLAQFKSALARRTDSATDLDANTAKTIHLFCLPTMPPAHLEALRELGAQYDIALYLRNPCQEYWFDIVAPRRLSYLALQGSLQHHDVGNRLLAAWGRQTQSQIDLIFETDLAATVDDSGFITNPNDCLLAHLQNAILDLRELDPASIALAEDDRSIEIHSCHSLTRELEVLQDQLLAMFAETDPPAPSDVLVILPDLDQSAPLIDAVFGSASAARRIPYTITGRPAIRTNVAGQALLDVLTLATSRMTATDVLALLQQSIIGRRFGFAARELDLLHTWLEQSGIRWGLDATHRASVGVPAETAHTFDDGMERLFLGYALPTQVATPFDQRIPAAGVEAGDAVVLGSFWHCLTMIDTLHRDVQRERNALDWHSFLQKVTEDFFAPDDEQTDQIDELKDCLFTLHDQLRRADVPAALPHEVVRAALGALLDDPLPGGVPTGSVTFASMSSLRNLPYQVICVLGLNDGVFPATDRALEFDLMAVAPRRGDRQRGADDRNLLLDVLLSARRRLLLSFTGRGIRDNAAMPPSVLLADLLDYLVPVIAADANDAASLATARRRLLVEHPLQPFSARYFTNDGDVRIGSSNSDYCDALKQAAMAAAVPSKLHNASDAPTDDQGDDEDVATSDDAPRFFTAPLSPPAPHWRTVSLNQLKQFFANPCNYLLQERLGMRLLRDANVLEDDEPFVPDRRGLRALEKRLLPLFLACTPFNEIMALAEAGIELPSGAIGRQTLTQIVTELQQFAAALRHASAASCLPAQPTILTFDLDGETWSLDAALADVRPSGLVRSRYDATRPSDYIAGWIDHLALNAALPHGAIGETLWLSRDGSYRLQPPDDAQRYLAELLRLYRYGLSQPLHFFPKSAWAFQTRGGNMTAARSTWQQTVRTPFAEQSHPAYRLALRGIANPLDADFEHAAQTVLMPLLACLVDERR